MKTISPKNNNIQMQGVTHCPRGHKLNTSEKKCFRCRAKKFQYARQPMRRGLTVEYAKKSVAEKARGYVAPYRG